MKKSQNRGKNLKVSGKFFVTLNLTTFEKISEILRLFFKFSDFSNCKKLQIFDVEKKNFLKVFFYFFLFFVKIMLMPSILPTGDPVTLPDTVFLLSDAEPKSEKSRI